MYRNSGILERLKRRDRTAQERVWQAERRRLLHVARATGGPSIDADALVADVFADFFFRFVDGIHKSSAIPAYLRIMAIRRAQRQRQRQEREIGIDETIQPAGVDDSVDAALDQRSYLMWLATCIEKLSDRARTILRMRYGLDQSLSEIGSYLGCSKQAVGKAAIKSLGALRRCIEAHRGRPMRERS